MVHFAVTELNMVPFAVTKLMKHDELILIRCDERYVTKYDTVHFNENVIVANDDDAVT